MPKQTQTWGGMRDIGHVSNISKMNALKGVGIHWKQILPWSKVSIEFSVCLNTISKPHNNNVKKYQDYVAHFKLPIDRRSIKILGMLNCSNSQAY